MGCMEWPRTFVRPFSVGVHGCSDFSLGSSRVPIYTLSCCRRTRLASPLHSVSRMLLSLMPELNVGWYLVLGVSGYRYLSCEANG